MRTARVHRDLPHHQAGWWLGHTAAFVAASLALLYAAAVLTVVVARQVLIVP